ncbi:MAG: DUF3089 domain-containing protein [Bacteroidetes bacterium]|nr:DUF3089 domain-containing protein [Bacteroidota bacterium]
MKTKTLLLLITLLANSCAWVHPTDPFNPAKIPPAPDYAKLDNWAAHPDKQDPADRTPCPNVQNMQDQAEIDVFFIHPTTYTGAERDQRDWNGSLSDAKLNKKTDDGTILFQASIFNGAGKVYAPRYRQAHLHVFFGKDKKSGQQALNLAHDDVVAAFNYYLKHWNKGRPFILAGHSQGGYHSMVLLRDMIEGTPLEKQLVAAYVVGWPVNPDYFKSLKPCNNPTQTDCYCTWRTFERNYVLKKYEKKAMPNIICTNPLNWNTQPGLYAPKSANLGGVIRPFCAIYPNLTDAEIKYGVIMCTKPQFQGSILFRTKNYHPGDLNLFYLNVRKNAQDRAAAYLKK